MFPKLQQTNHLQPLLLPPESPIPVDKSEDTMTSIPVESTSTPVDEIPIDDDPNSDIPDDPFDESIDGLDLTAGKNAINAWNINL